ncbi:hypothetical protein BJ684DRAFT_18833 [Piptocephalis cylindrospora]|uniref:Uncharacterized protein n=1 Tax=Piptocephalis cylindrospora TaxID=1907219 RepID=A0A4V1IYJ6_9FUNG|nr:hypothetical protein BJ684DRAFT_18833 [Piptocephalis cylindrospora]|eukprot:RKP14789.1 hypothetical protein BJ684DRAFT_18833 [Piptocephalis cylindrospora]
MGGNKEHSSTFRRLSLFPALPIHLGTSASQPSPSLSKSQDPTEYDNDPDLLLPIHPRRSSTSSTRSFFSRKRSSSSSVPSSSSPSSPSTPQKSLAPPTALGVTVIPSAPDHRPSPLSSTIPAPALSSTDFFVSPFLPSPLTPTPSKNPFASSSASSSSASSSSSSTASSKHSNDSSGSGGKGKTGQGKAGQNKANQGKGASKRLDPRRRADSESRSDPNGRWRHPSRVDEHGWRMVRDTIEHWIIQDTSPSRPNPCPLEDLTDVVRKRSFHIAPAEILIDLRETLAHAMTLLADSPPFTAPDAPKGLLLTQLGRVWCHIRLNILPRLDALFYSLRSVPPSLSASVTTTMNRPETRPRECVLAAFRDRFLLPLDEDVRDALAHWSLKETVLVLEEEKEEEGGPTKGTGMDEIKEEPFSHDTFPHLHEPTSTPAKLSPPPPPPPLPLKNSLPPPSKEEVGSIMATLVQMCGMLCNVPGEPESRKSILSLWSCIVDHHTQYTTRVADGFDRFGSIPGSDPSAFSSFSSSPSPSSTTVNSSALASSSIHPSAGTNPSTSTSSTSLPVLISTSPSLPPFIRPPYGGRGTRSGSVGSSFVFYTPSGRARSGTGPPLPSLPLVPVPSTSGHEVS